MAYRLSPEKKERVIALLKENKSDTEIIAITGYSASFVGAKTTEYWQQKMELKTVK